MKGKIICGDKTLEFGVAHHYEFGRLINLMPSEFYRFINDCINSSDKEFTKIFISFQKEVEEIDIFQKSDLIEFK